MHLPLPYLYLLFISVSFIGTLSLTAQVDLDHGLIGYWPMDSSATNESLNRFPRTDFVLDNTSYSNGWNGSKDRNGALYFYGASSASLQAAMPTAQVSISFWFNTSDPSGGTMLDWEQHGYGVQLNQGGRLYCWSYLSDNGFYDFLYDSKNLADGEWHHFVMTYNTNTFQVFIDGKGIHSDGSFGTDKPIYYGKDDNLNLGHSPQRGKPFTGNLDELLLYNRPLTSTEVELLAKRALPCWDKDLETGLLLRLPFHNDDLNKSPNHMDALLVQTQGSRFTESCNEENGADNRMKFVNGRDEQIKVNDVIQINGGFSLGFYFNTSSSKESFIAGWDSCGYRILLNPEGHTGKVALEWWSSPTSSYQYITEEYLNDGRCHHLVFTFYKGSSRIYLDGSLVDKQDDLSLPSSLFYSSSKLVFGMDDNKQNGWGGFQGKLDEICLYNRALTLEEVLSLKQQQFTTKQAISIKRYVIGGSLQNQIEPQGSILIVENKSDENQKISIVDGEKELESLKLKPGEHIIKEFPAEVNVDNVKVMYD